MATEQRFRARRDSGMLAFAAVANGLSAYAIVVFASRSFDDRGFASFSVAWSLWALGVALLVFPIQHWIIWRAARDGDTGAVRSSLPRVGLLVAAAVVVMFLAGSSQRLFPADEGWGVVIATVGLASAVLGFGRGALASRGRYDLVAWVIGLENIVRLGGVMMVVGLDLGPRAAAAALSLGALTLLPVVKHIRLDRTAAPGSVRVVAELGALAGATALAQVMVQFPPAYAEWLGDSAARVSAIFSTISLGRAPLLVLLALTPRLTAPLTRLMSDEWGRLRHNLINWLGIVLAATTTAGLIGFYLGPQIVVWFFGENRSLSQRETAYVAIGLVLAMAGVLAILALMAVEANRVAVLIYLAAVLMAGASGMAGIGIPVAFLASETVAAILATATLWVRARRTQVSSSSG